MGDDVSEKQPVFAGFLKACGMTPAAKGAITYTAQTESSPNFEARVEYDFQPGELPTARFTLKPLNEEGQREIVEIIEALTK